MATPLGHVLVGAGIGARLGPHRGLLRALLLGGCLGAAADLDFLPGLLAGAPARFHHAQSHSILAAILAGGLTYLLVRPRAAAWGLVGGLGYASHLLLDLVTVDDGAPFGIPLFWPVSSATFQSPITVFPRVPHSGEVTLGQLALLVAIEVVVCGGSFAWCLRAARRRGGSMSTERQPERSTGAAPGDAAAGEG